MIPIFQKVLFCVVSKKATITLVIIALMLQLHPFTFNVFAQGIKFMEGSFADVKAKAKKENKLIFADVYTSWCGPCKWMAKNVFTNDTAGRFYNEKFISYSLDAEKGEGISFAEKYKVNAYPTLLFLDSAGRMLHKAVGSREVKAFIALGEKALNPEQRLSVWQAKYSSGKRDTGFIRAYLNELSDAGMNKEAQEISAWYFYALPEKDKISKENFEMLKKFVHDTENKEFEYLLKNREKYYAVADKEKVNEKIKEVLADSWRNAVEIKKVNGKNELVVNEETYKDAIAKIKNSGFEWADELILEADMEYSKVKKDWKKYTEYTILYINMYKMNDYNALNNIAWSFYENEHITDKTAITQAVIWAKKSVELNPLYFNYDTYTAILYKAEKYKEAEKAALKAIELAKQSGDDASSTKELLNKIKKK